MLNSSLHAKYLHDEKYAYTSIYKFVGGFAIFAKRWTGHVIYILFKHNRII